jgi:hypothetical protein
MHVIAFVQGSCSCQITPLSLLRVIETFMPDKRQQFCGDLLHCELHKYMTLFRSSFNMRNDEIKVTLHSLYLHVHVLNSDCIHTVVLLYS